MNFLAHYQLAADLETSPHFFAGAILPDIAKRAGFSTPNSLLKDQQSAYINLYNGLKFHLEADRFFHNSFLFKEGMEQWKTGLDEKRLKSSKTFFLHHLLFEMWLDRILLHENPEAGIEMYQNLERVESHFLNQFSRSFYTDETGKIQSVFEGFLQRKFVLSYTSDIHFNQIAKGVFENVTNQKSQPELLEILGEKLLEMETRKSQFFSHWNEFKSDFFKSSGH